MSRVRPPAVAGSFYPGRASELSAAVRRYLEAAMPGEAGESARDNGLKGYGKLNKAGLIQLLKDNGP